MTTVTSLTADRMLAIEAASVVDGDVVGDNLILTKHDGSQINAGSVRGPTGSPGPVGQDLPILTAAPILDVGLSGQIRAGRQLTAADFTAMGLSAPVGLWNLSDLTDVSGNGRNLINKGAIPFDVGINGLANTSASFINLTTQGLYISDIGAADPFRFKVGSFGAWIKSGRRSAEQVILSKWNNTGNQRGWLVELGPSNVASMLVSFDGAGLASVNGVSDVCDGRWHFIVGIHDGETVRVYVDGLLEGSLLQHGVLFPSTSAFNIGSANVDAGTVAAAPWNGRIDEAFVTSDILSEDQIRNLYCAKIPHTLAAVPSRVSLNVHRRRKGATLATADFPTQPLRLFNFSGGSLGDEGSIGTPMNADAGVVSVPGVDGSAGNAFHFGGLVTLYQTDAGLPSALSTRSFGCWFKSIMGSGTSGVMLSWGTTGTGNAMVWNNAGALTTNSASDQINGPYVSDGQWHHTVVVEDNNAVDWRRKLYLDGRLVGFSATMNPIVLAGIAQFRVAANPNGTAPFAGQIDGAFVCNYALTAEQIWKLYAKSLITLASSPKNVGDHVEAMNANNLLATFDMLEMQHTIDLMVAP